MLTTSGPARIGMLGRPLPYVLSITEAQPAYTDFTAAHSSASGGCRIFSYWLGPIRRCIGEIWRNTIARIQMAILPERRMEWHCIHRGSWPECVPQIHAARVFWNSLAAHEMRRASRIDENQPDIIKAYRKLGCFVTLTHTLGDDFPDLVVSNYGLTWSVEIKSGNGKPSKGQQEFAEQCKGSHFIVRDINGVILSCDVMRDKADRLSRR